MASFAVALSGRFEPLGGGSSHVEDVAQAPGVTGANEANSSNSGADAVIGSSSSISRAKAFTDAFGSDARLVRTNDPGNMFAVETVAKNQDPGVVDDTVWHRLTATSSRWNYDAKTQTFTSPDGTKKVRASEIGLGGFSDGRAVPYMLAGSATLAGQNSDEWSRYALTHQKYAATDNGQFWQGALDLSRSVGDIISYDNNPGQGNKWAGLVISGGLALTGFGSVLAASMGGGILGAAGAGAVIGAGSAAITGGDIIKGAVIGAAGAAVGSAASGLEGGANFVGPLQGQPGLLSASSIANAAGQAGVSALAGGNPVTAGVSSLVGSATTNATGEQAVGSLASSATRMALADTPAVNTSVRSSPQNTVSVPATSPIGATQTNGNTNSPATFSSTLPGKFKYVNLSRG